ncbi:energy-coupling factor transporter transmembrane protein EcfT, partial [Micromonospora sp. NPDC000207]
IVLPVLADALDRSLALAAAMDSRGYGRTAAVPAGRRALTAGLALVGLVGVCTGTYGLLDATVPGYLGLPMLLAGLTTAVAGMLLAGRQVRRSRYRPDRWRPPEIVVAGCGAVTPALMVWAGTVDPARLYPPVAPLTWPELTPLVVLAVAVAVLPAWAAPPPPLAARPVEGRRPARPPRGPTAPADPTPTDPTARHSGAGTSR